jgi:hypothetical protein
LGAVGQIVVELTLSSHFVPAVKGDCGPHACLCSVCKFWDIHRSTTILAGFADRRRWGVIQDMFHELKKYARAGVVSVFDADEVRILTTAFDEAWKAVQDSGVSFVSNGHSEATREFLALRIIEMAQLGERDSHRLRDDAILHLARSNLKSSGP